MAPFRAARLAVRRLFRDFEIRTGFACGRNVFAAGPLQDFFRLAGPIAVIAVHRQQDRALLDPAFEALRFVFWNADADQRAADTANRAANAPTGQRGCMIGPAAIKDLIARESPARHRYRPTRRAHRPGSRPCWRLRSRLREPWCFSRCPCPSSRRCAGRALKCRRCGSPPPSDRCRSHFRLRHGMAKIPNADVFFLVKILFCSSVSKIGECAAHSPVGVFTLSLQTRSSPVRRPQIWR